MPHGTEAMRVQKHPRASRIAREAKFEGTESNFNNSEALVGARGA